MQGPVALAYREVHKRPAALKSTAWKVWLVLGDCTLIGLAPVLVHMAKDAEGHYAFRCAHEQQARLRCVQRPWPSRRFVSSCAAGLAMPSSQV